MNKRKKIFVELKYCEHCVGFEIPGRLHMCDNKWEDLIQDADFKIFYTPELEQTLKIVDSILRGDE